MPKKFFKRYSPDPKRIKDTPGLGILSKYLQQPNLWHFNRRSVSKAFAIGLFFMWIPFPFQSMLAAIAAIYTRANLALSVALVFITNPITIPPMFYFSYQLGNLVLGRDSMKFNINLSWEWITESLIHIWQPLFVGCFLSALFTSMLGFLAIQAIWRYNVRTRQKLRSTREKITTKTTDD